MYYWGVSRRSGARAVSVPKLAVAIASFGLICVASGALVGYWVARKATVQAAGSVQAAPDLYTLEQLGTISGRMFKLESEAALLGRKIGILQGVENHPPPAARQPMRKPAAGGPLLPPQADVAATLLSVEAIESSLRQVELALSAIGEEATRKGLVGMSFPSRRPIESAEIESNFGNRIDPFTGHLAMHSGIDFMADSGTAIHSAAGGRVTFAGGHPQYGRLIEIDHGNGLVTRYAHASKLLVGNGAVVLPGEKIALVGSSGRTTGPHLHFEVLSDGQYLNPLALLDRR